jgi:apolipoprotein N-acyltransferase
MKVKDYLLASLSGLLLILSFPQWNLFVLAWVSIVPLLYAVRGRDAAQGCILGAVTGLVFNLGLVYWVTVSMTTYGKMPAALSLLVLLLFAAYLSLFIAVPVWCSCYVERRLGIALTATLPFFWTAGEYVKSWFLTGFPWESLGYSQFLALPVVQIADITGVYGISFLLVLVNGVAAAFLEAVALKKSLPYRSLTTAALLLAAALLYGTARLERFDRAGAPQGLAMALVQGNISQDVKWNPSFLDETMNIYGGLTLAAAPQKPALVIWPEAATPFFFQSERTYQEKVAAVMRKVGAYLLLGSPAWENAGNRTSYFNSAFLVAPDGTIAGRYDKMHLVPYGEYVPLKPLFPFIEKMVVGIGDFSSGSEVRNLHFPGGTFGTLICYEIIFPDLVRRFAKNGAEFLVNITNDAWFGSTAAPYQHLSMAALRAIENRRWVARAANTGISAFISAGGRITQQSKLFTPASLTGTILKENELTFYTQRGDVFALLCTLLSCAVLGIPFITARRRSKKF